MANILQRIFLSKSRIKEIDRQQEILKLITEIPQVSQRTTVVAKGIVYRTFAASTIGRNIYVSHVYDPSKEEEHRVTYNLCYHIDGVGTRYATNSNISKFAKTVYDKIYKKREQNKQHVK